MIIEEDPETETIHQKTIRLIWFSTEYRILEKVFSFAFLFPVDLAKQMRTMKCGLALLI